MESREGGLKGSYFKKRVPTERRVESGRMHQGRSNRSSSCDNRPLENAGLVSETSLSRAVGREGSPVKDFQIRLLAPRHGRGPLSAAPQDTIFHRFR